MYDCPRCRSLTELTGNVYLMGDDGVVVNCPECDVSQTFRPREEYEKAVHSVLRTYGHPVKIDGALVDCTHCDVTDSLPADAPLWKRNMYRFALMKKHDCGEMPAESIGGVSVIKRIKEKIVVK